MDKQQSQQQQPQIESDSYQLLQEAIAQNNAEQVSKASDKIMLKDPSDEQVRLCQVISLMKLNRFPEIWSNYFSKIPQANEIQQKILAYLLYLIKKSQYNDCITYIKKNNLNTKYEYELFLAHCYFKLQQLDLASETYLSILKKVEKVDLDLYNLCLVNAISCGSNPIAQQLAENHVQKNIQYSKEILFNLGVVYSKQKKIQSAIDILQKFKDKLDSNKSEDSQYLVMSNILQDLSIFSSTAPSISSNELQEKIIFYQDAKNKFKIQFQNQGSQSQPENQLLALLVNNNLICLRNMAKKDNFNESLKLFEQCIQINQTLPEVQSQNQLPLALNKLILLLNKNKLNECVGLFKSIEKQNNELTLIQNKSYLVSKIGYLLKLDNSEELQQYLAHLYQLAQSNALGSQIKLVIFLISAEVYRLRNEQQKILDLFVSMKSMEQLLENEIIYCFIFNLLTNNKQLFQQNLKIIDNLANSNNVQILEQIYNIYKKQGDNKKQVQIIEKIIAIAPEQSKYKLELAQIYCDSDIIKAEQLVANLKYPFAIIEDYNELEKLQSDLVLSKMKQEEKEFKKEDEKGGQQGLINQSKQIKKKQKKKSIRYPKNFDPNNPGQMPNPERWLPKWQRKDYKKKKDKYKNRTQGSANVGQETVNTFSKNNITTTKAQESNIQKMQKKKKQK